MKLLTVIGARPQFIKAAMISRAFVENPRVEETLVHTGQHYDKNMSDLFFEEMMIPKPAHHLHAGGGSHAEMTAGIMVKLEKLCLEIKPDALMVYGDTNSTIAGALCASKMHIPVFHVEAGLRSYNNRMPEEINRIVTDRISSLLFCPTQTAVDNLQREGFANFPAKIVLTGDVMLDSLIFYTKIASERPFPLPDLKGKPFALCTIHRAENTNDLERLKAILSALTAINEELPVVLPLHPRTRGILKDQNIATGGIRFIDPVGYFDMLQLMNASQIILTDSGGLQKEAYFCQKPCVILRDETEWVELSSTGASLLAGADRDRILDSYRRLKTQKVTLDKTLFGDGHATDAIVNAVENF